MNRPNGIDRLNRPGAAASLTATLAATLIVCMAAHAAPAQGPAAATPSTSTVSPTAAVPAAAADIRDIRGPKPLGGGWTLPMVLIAGVLIGAAAYGSYAWSRRRRTPLPRSPAEIALARLAAAQHLIDAGAGREFSIEVSGIVRTYIEDQFHVRAAHRTTDEFLHDLLQPSQRVLAAHRDNLEGFLETCDLAKFGGWNLSAADMEALRAGAQRFVSESGIDPAPATAAPTTFTASTPYVAFPST